MPISAYSTTAGSNTSVAGINIAEGCPAANVNNGMRAQMADTRSFYEAATWTDLGHTPTRTGATTFTVVGDLTAYYVIGRRIRCTDSSTLYGTISNSSYGAPNTTVTVTLDSGSLSVSLTAVSVSVIDPTGDPIGAGAITGEIAIGSIPASITGFLVPTGAISAWSTSTAPTGWELCRGQAINRTTFANLFAVIGTTYGVGDGSTTFNLPDITGRVIAGQEASATRLTSGVSGVDGGTLGASGGNQNMQQHNHATTETPHSHSLPANLALAAGAGSAANATTSGLTPLGTTGTASTGLTINNTGTGSSQNVQPTIVLNYIIKT
jgi:microcystin-dependent protein